MDELAQILKTLDVSELGEAMDVLEGSMVERGQETFKDKYERIRNK